VRACQHNRVPHRSTRRARTWPRVSACEVIWHRRVCWRQLSLSLTKGRDLARVAIAHFGELLHCDRLRFSLVLLRHPIRGVSSPPTSLSPTTVVTGATLCSLNSLRAVVARGQLRNFSVCSCWPSILLTHSTTVQQPIPVIHTACVHNGALGDFHAPCTEQRKGVISAQVRLCGWPSADQQGVWREHRLAHRALVHGGVVCETRTHSSARSERARCWRHCHLMPISAAAALNRTFSFTRV
jgi:hypothetical protein